ncbi:MAG: ABC transporter permease, partial [Candidatus Bathyarchaeia archaeon]
PTTGVLLGFAAVVLGSVFFGAFAIIVSTLVKTEQAFSALFNLLFLLFMFLSSAFYPVTAAPPVLQSVLLLNPLTHAADLLRFGLFNLASPFVLWETIALPVESALVFALAVFAFRRIKV